MQTLQAYPMDGMNPGDYRDLIAFYTLDRSVGKDKRGGGRPDDEFLVETFAKIKPMKPITSMQNDQLTVIQPYSVTIRDEGDFAPLANMIVVYNGTRYLIKNVMEADTRQRQFTFMMIKAG